MVDPDPTDDHRATRLASDLNRSLTNILMQPEIKAPSVITKDEKRLFGPSEGACSVLKPQIKLERIYRHQTRAEYNRQMVRI